MVYLSPTEPIVITLRPGSELFFSPGNAFRLVDQGGDSVTVESTAPAGVSGTFAFVEDGAPIEEFLLAHGGKTSLDFSGTPIPEPPVIEEAAGEEQAEEPSLDRTTMQLGAPPQPR